MNNLDERNLLEELKRLLNKDSDEISKCLEGDILPMYNSLLEKEIDYVGDMESELNRINTEMY